jgi:hypothetical protein
MRAIRLSIFVLIAAVALTATACTNPTGPAPAGDDVISSGI